MIGEKKLQEITKVVLKASKADQTEVLVSSYNRNLTRFANSQIHQHVGWQDAGVSVRAVVGKKIGVAATNKLDKASLEKVAQKAYELATMQQEDPNFVSLPKHKKLPEAPSAFMASTATASPDQKAKMVKTIIDKAVANNLTASGAFNSVISEMAIANSLGVWGYHTSTANDLSTVLLGENKTGYGAQFDKDFAKINAEKVADTAIEKATFPKDPIELAEGEYEVVLDPNCLGDEFLGYYAWLGPNARVFHEGASHVSDNLGKKLYSEKLTITDDPLNEAGMPIPFDFEGYPKKVLPLVENGVATNICYDSYNANRYKKQNTGHALPAPNTYGPMPLHLTFAPGKKSMEDMIRSVKRGIYVTRFWYIRMLHHKLLNVTGMTRDGTFLIENGEFVVPVKNLRFTQSIPEAFANIIDVGDTLTLQGGWGGAYLVPALRIGKFTFTGKTLF